MQEQNPYLGTCSRKGGPGHQKNTTGRGANFKKGQPAGDAGRSKVGKKGVNLRQGLPDGKRGRAIGRKVQHLRSLLKYAGRKSRAGMGTTSQASSESSSAPIRNRPVQQQRSALPPAQPTQYSLQLLTPGPVGRPAVTQPSRLSALPSLGQQFSLPLHSLETQQPQQSSPSPSFPNPFPQASSYSSSHQTQPHSAAQRSPPGTPINAQMWDPFASLAHDPTDDLPMFTWD